MNHNPNPKKHSEERRRVYIPPPIPPPSRTANRYGLILIGTIGVAYSIYNIFLKSQTPESFLRRYRFGK